MDDTDCHVPPATRSDVSSKTYNIIEIITLLSIIIHHSHRCFHFYINIDHCNISPTRSSYHDTLDFSSIFHNTMNTAEYWLMAWEYGIWNTAIASLQFWAEDLDPVSLDVASDDVYNHFFWTSTSNTLCWLSNETLFGCFVLALNAAFTHQLSLADEGYESGSNEDLPTPLCKTPCIYHISSLEHASFNPIHSTPCRPVAPASDLTYSPTRPAATYLSVVTATT